MRKCKYSKGIEYVLIAVTVFFVFGTIYYTVFLSQQFTNSDIFDTLMWANASYETKRIIAPDYNYAALLPFGASLLMLPFIKIFGLSFMAHALGMAVFEIIFFAVMIIFLKKLSFGVKSSCFAIIGMCGLWMCSDKMREMFMEHTIYYSLSILFIMAGWVLLDSLEKAIESKKKNRFFIIIVAVVFFLLVATDGAQMLAISTLPLLLGFAIERFIDVKTPLFSKNNKSLIFSAAIVLTSSVVGLAVLKLLTRGVVSEYANENSVYDSTGNILDYVNKFSSYIKAWYTNLEVLFSENAPLTDANQLESLLMWMLATVLIFVLPVNLILYNKIKSQNIKRLISVTLSLRGVIFALWVFGIISVAGWRLIPSIVMSFILLITDAVYLYRNVELKRFAVPIVVMILVFSLNSYNYVLAYKPVKNAYEPYDDMITDIYNHNVKNGYADFWIVNEFIVLTKGDLKIEPENLVKGGNICIYEYQNFKKEKYGTYNSPTFLALPSKHEELFEDSEGYEKAKPYLTDKTSFKQYIGGYVVYYYSCDIYSIIGEQGE